MTDRYILGPDHVPYPEPDLMTWARWFEEADRRVALTLVGPYEISTVFLGLDHAGWWPRGHGRPARQLFETMVFRRGGGSALDFDTRRYPTWAAAEAGHAEMVAEVEGQLAARRRS